MCLGRYVYNQQEIGNREDFILNEYLKREKTKCRAVLHNILPSPEFVDRLFNNWRFHRQPDVSILYSDLKGYTKFCSEKSPGDVAELLNTLYLLIDHHMEKWSNKLHKIDTIGDAVMVVSGLRYKEITITKQTKQNKTK